MNICHGCGKPASYYKKKSNRWWCKPSPNSCPSKRKKNSGENNPSKRPETREKISKINSVLFSSDSDYRKKCKETLLKNYGVDNPAKDKTIYSKVVKKRKETGSYKYRPVLNSPEANKKRKETRIKKGYDMDPSLFDPFQRYEKEVDRLTEKTYKENRDIINPENHIRGRTKGCYQLDHIVSKIDGFLWGLTPEELSHPQNLRMLTITENISKSKRSDMTAENLRDLIYKTRN